MRLQVPRGILVKPKQVTPRPHLQRNTAVFGWALKKVKWQSPVLIHKNFCDAGRETPAGVLSVIPAKVGVEMLLAIFLFQLFLTLSDMIIGLLGTAKITIQLPFAY